MMMILSPIGLIKSAGFESDFHYYDVTDLLFMVIPYFSRGQKSKHRQKCKISSAIKILDPCRVSRDVVSFYWTELRIRNHVFPPGQHEIPFNILLPPAFLFFPAINFISWRLFLSERMGAMEWKK